VPFKRPFRLSLFLLLVATVPAGASGPPGAVTDLAATPGAADGTIDLSWSSPGDDGYSGDLEGFFRIDYSSSSPSFSTSSYLVEIATDAEPGSPQSYTLTGLSPGATYYVNVWGVDDAMVSGPLSNNATAQAQGDATPPAAVADLAAAANWRQVRLTWTSPGDDGGAGALNGVFRVRWSTQASVADDASFAAAPFELLVPTSAAAGAPQSLTITGLANGVAHYFGLRAEDERSNAGAVLAGSASSASPANTAPGVFAVTAPADGFIAAAEPSLLFQWQANGDPDSAYGDDFAYVFELSADPAFLSGVARTEGISSGTPQLSSATSNLVEDATNYWRVRAVDLEGAERTTASRRVFRNAVNSPPGAFALLSPSDGANVATLQPALDWQDAVDPDPGSAVTYRVEYSTSASFAGASSQAGLSASQFTVPSPLQEDATYYWRVFAADGATETAAGPFRFGVDASATAPAPFGLLSPADGVRLVAASATFSWQSSSDPDPGDVLTYDLVYSFLPNFASSVAVTGLTSTSHGLTLGDNLAVYWFVRARDLLGNTRHSNEAQRLFTLDVAKETPGAFTLTTPTGAATVSTLRPTLQWTAAADPDPLDMVRYTVEWSADAGFAGAQSAQVADTFLQVPSDLVDDTTYFWRVRAGGYQGTPPVLQDPAEVSAGTGTFLTSIPNTPPQPFALLSPADGATVSTVRPAFDWADAADVDHNELITYTLKVSTAADLSGAQEFAGIAASAFTPPGPLRENAVHYWRVTAVDKDGGRTDSGVFRFSIPVLTRPRAPGGVEGAFSGKALYTLRWNPVTTNTDGSPVADLAGYRIYRALFVEDVAAASPLGFSPAGTDFYEDHTVNGGDFFYLVRAVDDSGVEGPPSLMVESRADAVVVAIAEDGGSHAVIPFEARRDLSAATNGLGEDLTVLLLRREFEETGAVLRSYALEVQGTDSQKAPARFRFQSPVEVAFAVDPPGSSSSRPAPRRTPAPSLPAEQMSVFWFNGVEYVKLGGRYDPERRVVSVLTRQPGVYRLQQALQAGSFGLVQLFPNKIFTPNGDGVNDEMNFLVENPKGLPVSGEVFDLLGARVAELKAGSVASSLVWDGRGRDGDMAPKGVYLYQIESDGRKMNGAIVVAR
jgi:hypothetical protein